MVVINRSLAHKVLNEMAKVVCCLCVVGDSNMWNRLTVTFNVNGIQ